MGSPDSAVIFNREPVNALTHPVVIAVATEVGKTAGQGIQIAIILLCHASVDITFIPSLPCTTIIGVVCSVDSMGCSTRHYCSA